MNNQELANCPFCGSEDLNEFTYNEVSQFGTRSNQMIQCKECKAEHQKKMWNIRHPKEPEKCIVCGKGASILQGVNGWRCNAHALFGEVVYQRIQVGEPKAVVIDRKGLAKNIKEICCTDMDWSKWLADALISTQSSWLKTREVPSVEEIAKIINSKSSKLFDVQEAMEIRKKGFDLSTWSKAQAIVKHLKEKI